MQSESVVLLMTSSMKNKMKLIFYVLSLVIWLGLWEILARTISLSFIVPTVLQTFVALVKLVATRSFYVTVLTSLLRVILGFTFGTLLGIALAIASYNFQFSEVVLSPMISILRATPVASFIMILWFLLGGGKIPVVIAILMVLPMVYQGMFDGLRSVDNSLKEVATIFKLSFLKKIKLLYFPSLLKVLLPTIITASGLAWKAGVAAEIITYTRNSIGASISDAKNSFEGPEMFAWTIVVIFISIMLELLMRKGLRRIREI